MKTIRQVKENEIRTELLYAIQQLNNQFNQPQYEEEFLKKYSHHYSNDVLERVINYTKIEDVSKELEYIQKVIATFEPQNTKHTPLPWKFTPNSFNYEGLQPDDSIGSITSDTDIPWYIATLENAEEQEANAEFIVRACNSHYELIEALEEISKWIGNGEHSDDRGNEPYWTKDYAEVVAKVHAALAKAKGGVA